jgi:hypothetical protein
MEQSIIIKQRANCSAPAEADAYRQAENAYSRRYTGAAELTIIDRSSHTTARERPGLPPTSKTEDFCCHSRTALIDCTPRSLITVWSMSTTRNVREVFRACGIRQPQATIFSWLSGCMVL